jgi:hypothetical protein
LEEDCRVKRCASRGYCRVKAVRDAAILIMLTCRAL